MTLKHIRIFLTVYQKESITKAAQHLGITQPAASLAIKELETHYQTTLFERKGRGMQATAAADHLYPLAQNLLYQYEEMERQLIKPSPPNKLCLGACSTIASTLLPRLIHSFSKNNPSIKLYTSVNTSKILQQQVLNSQLDFALVEEPFSSENLRSLCFLQEEILPICAPSHPFANAANISIKELEEESILLPAKDIGVRKQLDIIFSRNKITIVPAMETTDTAALIHGVSSDIGISFLPKSLLHMPLHKHQLSTFSLTAFAPSCHYSLIYKKEKLLTPYMKDFFKGLPIQKKD